MEVELLFLEFGWEHILASLLFLICYVSFSRILTTDRNYFQEIYVKIDIEQVDISKYKNSHYVHWTKTNKKYKWLKRWNVSDGDIEGASFFPGTQNVIGKKEDIHDQLDQPALFITHSFKPLF